MVKQFFITVPLIILFVFGNILAQPVYPRISPGASVSQKIGITDLTITYHRPGVKNRLVWGELVPLDKIWRAGANEATTIEFSHDVMIDSKTVPAGKYSLFVLPNTKSTTFILNKDAGLWGTYGYDEKNDILRVRAELDLQDHQEWMIYTFENVTKNSADILLSWEDFGLRFPIKVDTDKYVLEGARQAKGWKQLMQAAAYCMENDVALDEGNKWIDQSVTEEKNYWNLSLKARYLAKEDQYDGARQVMSEAIELGKAMEEKPYNLKEAEELLKKW